jgi:hypothetical protein
MLRVRTGSSATTVAVRYGVPAPSSDTSPKCESRPMMLTMEVSPDGLVICTATRPSSTMWKLAESAPSWTRTSRRA